MGTPLNNNDHPGSDVNPFGAISIHGGDFEGLTEKLDYIHMLGYRGIWISPVVNNVKGTFHGYAAQDFTQIDPHWGTLDDLRTFIDAAHAKDMYVFIDVVQNHMGRSAHLYRFWIPKLQPVGLLHVLAQLRRAARGPLQRHQQILQSRECQQLG